MATTPKPTQTEPIVQLHRNVLERLNRDVRKAFEADRPQGAEIGGLLLGTANLQAGSIEIQNFEPLLGEVRSDGRFIISGSEGNKLENALRQRNGPRRVVGCYRSHISPAMTLSVDDFAFAQLCLCESGGLFLLIPPSPEGTLKAGFFFWQDSHIDSKFSFHECLFDTQTREVAQPLLPSFQVASLAHTLSVSRLGVISGGSVKAPRQQGRVEQRPERANALPGLSPAFSPPVRAKLWRARALGWFAALWSAIWSWTSAIRWRARARNLWKSMAARPLYPVVALSIVAVCLLVYIAWPILRNFERTAGNVELQLQVDRREGNLVVNWNQNSSMLQAAQGAVLTIRDGGSGPVELQLEREQLRSGNIMYSPKSANVQFSLEIIASNGMRTTRSVTALTAPRLGDSKPLTAALKPPAARRADHDRSAVSVLESALRFTREKSIRVAPRDVQIPSPAAQSPVPEKADPPSINATAVGNGEVAVSAAYVPPRALRESRPLLSSAIRAAMTSDVELQVKVKINDSGSVTRADTLNARGPATRSLVGVTEQAALLWKFTPAMRWAVPVPSEAVVVFRFRPSVE